MTSNFTRLIQWSAIFMAGFAVAWVIRTPGGSNARQHAARTVLPDRRPLSSTPVKQVDTNSNPSAASKRPPEVERSFREASNQLVDAQGLLAQARDAAFKDDPGLGYAYETWKTYEGWQNMGATGAALGWWDNQRDPEVRRAMREVTRKMLVQELAARLSDPTTRDWILAWFGKNQVNTEEGVMQRQKWWSDDFVALPSFASLPPPDILASLLDPTKAHEILKDFQFTEDERRLINPSIFFYLEGSAQAGVISNSGEAYYHEKKGPRITSLESEVDTKNRRAVDLSTPTGDPE